MEHNKSVKDTLRRIGMAAEKMQDELKVLESDLIILKVQVSRGTISKSSLLRVLDKLLSSVKDVL